MASIFQGRRDPLDPNNLPTVFPYDPYFGQVFYDWKSKEAYEYIECGEGSTDEDGLPVCGIWVEINWDFKRLP